MIRSSSPSLTTLATAFPSSGLLTTTTITPSIRPTFDPTDEKTFAPSSAPSLDFLDMDTAYPTTLIFSTKKPKNVNKAKPKKENKKKKSKKSKKTKESARKKEK